MNRRGFLIGSATLACIGLTGCIDAFSGWLTDLVFDDVTVLNAADQPISGSVLVTGPEGDIVLDASFDLVTEEAAGDSDEDSGALFEDVLTDAGAYTVTVDLDEEVDGMATQEETVTIDRPEEEYIIVAIGAEELDGGIEVFVIEDLTDLEEIIGDPPLE